MSEALGNLIAVFIAQAVITLLVAPVVMLLWNVAVADLFNLGPVGYWQTVGLMYFVSLVKLPKVELK